MAQILISKRVICIKYKAVIRVFALNTPGSMRALQSVLRRQTILNKKTFKQQWQLLLAPPLACCVAAPIAQSLLPFIYLQTLAGKKYAINRMYYWRLYLLLRNVNIRSWQVW